MLQKAPQLREGEKWTTVGKLDNHDTEFRKEKLNGPQIWRSQKKVQKSGYEARILSVSHIGSPNKWQCLGLIFVKCIGEEPEVKLTGLGLSEYCQPKPVFLGQISISIVVISHYLKISDENHSCLQCLMHLLSNNCVPGSMLSIHGEASESSWCFRT